MFEIIPIGYRVLVKSTLEKKTKSGIILAADEKMEAGAKDKGTIVSLGSTAGQHPDLQWSNSVKVGDTVVWAKYAGKQIFNPADPEGIYILLNDSDILGVINESATEAA